MTPQMVEALYRISLLFAPEPETVFRQIAETVADLYGNSMAMVNLVDGDCLRFRTVVNMHPIFKRAKNMDLQGTLCNNSIRDSQPILIQNAMEHPDFCRHIVVRLKLRRYLGVPICTSAGAPVGTLCFLDDHTDNILGEDDIQFLSFLAMRVSAELERERLIEARIEEQRAHAERLTSLNTLLQETAEEKRRFVSMVLHDLRHPVTTLRSSIYLLRIEPDEQQRLSHLSLLESRTKALSSLLDELVLYDRIEAGQTTLKIEQVDLNTVIGDCIEEAGNCAYDDAVALRWELDSDLGYVAIDGSKLKHILLNLLANALKFTRQGSIVVRARVLNPNEWQLEVEDTGIGMTSTEKLRAFDEYFSGARQDHEGVGLGLAITRRLCTVLNAKIFLESAPDRGTHFRIVFPRTLAAPEMKTERTKNEPKEAGCRTSGKQASGDNRDLHADAVT